MSEEMDRLVSVQMDSPYVRTREGVEVSRLVSRYDFNWLVHIAQEFLESRETKKEVRE